MLRGSPIIIPYILKEGVYTLCKMLLRAYVRSNWLNFDFWLNQYESNYSRDFIASFFKTINGFEIYPCLEILAKLEFDFNSNDSYTNNTIC